MSTNTSSDLKDQYNGSNKNVLNPGFPNWATCLNLKMSVWSTREWGIPERN